MKKAITNNNTRAIKKMLLRGVKPQIQHILQALTTDADCFKNSSSTVWKADTDIIEHLIPKRPGIITEDIIFRTLKTNYIRSDRNACILKALLPHYKDIKNASLNQWLQTAISIECKNFSDTVKKEMRVEQAFACMLAFFPKEAITAQLLQTAIQFHSEQISSLQIVRRILAISPHSFTQLHTLIGPQKLYKLALQADRHDYSDNHMLKVLGRKNIHNLAKEVGETPPIHRRSLSYVSQMEPARV